MLSPRRPVYLWSAKSNSMVTQTSIDAALQYRPTEAQLRWAQFHRASRAHNVRRNVALLYTRPLRVDDVIGAYPEDGNSSTSFSDIDIKESRPRVSAGRRALLRVSRRNYTKRSSYIEEHGFSRRCGEAAATSDCEDENELNDIFMVKRRRKKKGRAEEEERLKRFEDACHAMVMNLAQPEERSIIIPTRRWTRSADHIEASAVLNSEYLDLKWGIRHKTESHAPQTTTRQFVSHHSMMMPVDREASWLVHLPNHISSSRTRPSNKIYQNTSASSASSEFRGSVVSDKVSEGGESVSTLAMKAPGREKFNQLVALAQQRVLKKGTDDNGGVSNKNIHELNIMNSSLYEELNKKREVRRHYVPRMRLRDFVGSTDKAGYHDTSDVEEFSLQELEALNRIPRGEYLELVKAGKTNATQFSTPAKVDIPQAHLGILADRAEVLKPDNSIIEGLPEQLLILESVVARRLLLLEGADGKSNEMRESRAFNALKSQSAETTTSNDAQDLNSIAVFSSLKNTIENRLKQFEAGSVKDGCRVSRARKLLRFFEDNSSPSQRSKRRESLSPRPLLLRNSGLRHRESGTLLEKLQPEELVAMKFRIQSYIGKHELKGQTSLVSSRINETMASFSHDDVKEMRIKLRDSYDSFEEQCYSLAEKHFRISDALILQELVTDCIRKIENGADEAKSERLSRAKLLQNAFERSSNDTEIRRVQQLLASLQDGSHLDAHTGTLIDSLISHPRPISEREAAEKDVNTHTNGRVSDFFERMRHMNSNKFVQPAGAISNSHRQSRADFESLDGHLHQSIFTSNSISQNKTSETTHEGESTVMSRVNSLENRKITSSPNMAGNTEGSFDSLWARGKNGLGSLAASLPHSANPSASAGTLRDAALSVSERVGMLIHGNADSSGIPLTETSPAPGRQLFYMQQGLGNGPDSEIDQPSPPPRSNVEQEKDDAVFTTNVSNRDRADCAPDDLDFLSAFRKKRESLPSADDRSSVSSFQALPADFRDVVKQYTPTRRGHSQARVRGGENGAKTPETASQNSWNSRIAHRAGQADATSNTGGDAIDPTALSSLMLSPDLLTKRHQQAVLAIERQQWDDVNYLINANPWLCEMCEATTNQYLLHKLSFFGAGHHPAPFELCSHLMEKFPPAVYKFDEDGNVPLHLAAAANHVDMIGMLGTEFESGASIRNQDGMLPLHFAIASCGRSHVAETSRRVGSGRLMVVESLLELFPKAVAIADNEGNLPLHVAVECLDGDAAVQVISLLLDEAERQLRDPFGARFYNKAQCKEAMSDYMTTAGPTLDVDPDDIIDTNVHCTVVQNNQGKSALAVAIHACRGWRIVEAIVSGPGGKEAALQQDVYGNNALHLLVGDYADAAAALSVLKEVPIVSTVPNDDGMLPIEVSRLQNFTTLASIFSCCFVDSGCLHAIGAGRSYICNCDVRLTY